ncbi:MAG TPA: hypothetical protein VJC03_07810 [bacterium]|nr:hypothetical protein [bacterium]
MGTHKVTGFSRFADWLRRGTAFFLCLVAAVLPSRFRVIFIEIIGWIFQLLYLWFKSLTGFLIRQLQEEKGGRER